MRSIDCVVGLPCLDLNVYSGRATTGRAAARPYRHLIFKVKRGILFAYLNQWFFRSFLHMRRGI